MQFGTLDTNDSWTLVHPLHSANVHMSHCCTIVCLQNIQQAFDNSNAVLTAKRISSDTRSARSTLTCNNQQKTGIN